MAEAPGITGVEGILGGGEIWGIGGPAAAICANPVQIHDLAQAREMVDVVVIMAGCVLHAVAGGAIFRVELTALFYLRLVDRRGYRKCGCREVPDPGPNPFD